MGKRTLIIAGLSVVAVVFVALSQETGHMGPFIIIPEPDVADLVRSGFSVNKTAMAEHYSALLAGKRFDEVHDMLKEHGLTYNIKDERRLVFSPRYEFAGLPASYSCTIEISFDNGEFAKVLDIYNCGVLAL